MPYTRYFLADILQFQFHRALCEDGRLHEARSTAARSTATRTPARSLHEMLAMGQRRPWPDALEALTGQREMDATAILDYFAPLKKWLDEQNKGKPVGW